MATKKKPVNIVRDTLALVPEPQKERVQKVLKSYNSNPPLALKVSTVLLKVIDTDINLLPDILKRLELHFTKHTQHHHPFVREEKEVTVNFFNDLYIELNVVNPTIKI